MNKSMQIAFFCLVAASAVFARPGYLGYPYAGAAGPYAAGIHGAPLPVHDTPEVAAAKAAHFAAYNAAASAAAAAPDTGAYDGAYGGPYAGGAYAGGAYGGAYGGPYAGGAYAAGAYGAAPYAAAPYAGLYAGAPAIVHGVPADTPEVAAAKAAHFAAHAKAAHHYG